MSGPGSAGPTGGGPRVTVGRGARAVERLLLADLEALLAGSPGDVGLLAWPVVVVVPSRSLRQHVASRIVAARGRAAAGVEVVTLHGLAAAIVARHRAQRGDGTILLPVLVSRFASREPALRDLAASLEDGELPVTATVRDLLDAGLTPEGAEALLEMLQDRRGGAGAERAAALVRVASAVARVLEAAGMDLASDLLRRAKDLLRERPDRALPARAVLVHGFADATGVATDFIETLLRERGAWLYLDEPPDPADATRPDPGVVFGARFSERLRGVTAFRSDEGPAEAPPQPELFRAPGAHAEVREVARRIRRLLDAGVAPERIGVVARELAPYAMALDVHFRRLGIPFSAPGTRGSADASARRVRALSELLRRGAEAPADIWVSAVATLAAFDLRLALHACGALRVHDVAALEVEPLLDENGDLALPVRRGLAEVPGEGGDVGDEGMRVAPRRRMAGTRLRSAVERASVFETILKMWPAEAKPAAHAARLKRLLDEGLGWRSGASGGASVAEVLATLAGGVPPGLALSRDEFFHLVRGALAGVEPPPLGGSGGGVQLLSVIEARARTFAHLFVLGLNRDSFPRQVREDPLLPDGLRVALAAVLPDIPIKRAGFDEERFLFAQLLSSAEAVTLSSLACDDDGRARAPSPLVERLRAAGRWQDAPLAGGVLTPQPGELRPPAEHAVLAGLHGTRREFGLVLETACAEIVGAGGPALAEARLAVLDEMDPDLRTAAGRGRSAALGPYFGFVGAPKERADPRRSPPAVTTAENLAGCPWQAFLRRILRLEPSPDPRAAAAGPGAAVVGHAVHRVLEALVGLAGDVPHRVAEALDAPAVPVPWPSPAELDRVVAEQCRRAAREGGLTLPGLDRVLAARVAGVLEAARRLLWPDERSLPAVVGVEAEGEVPVPDAGAPTGALAFRADLVTRAEGRIVLTDFKTGAPLSRARTESTRRRHLLEAIRSGGALQVASYALAAGGRAASGRYLFLRPDLEDELRELSAGSDDPEVRESFTAAVRVILEAWSRGALFPRLEEPGGGAEPRRCSSCELRDACVRGDTGARRRLARWAGVRAAAGDRPSPAEAAVRALWNLGVTEGAEEGAE